LRQASKHLNLDHRVKEIITMKRIGQPNKIVYVVIFR